MRKKKKRNEKSKRGKNSEQREKKQVEQSSDNRCVLARTHYTRSFVLITTLNGSDGHLFLFHSLAYLNFGLKNGT